MAQTVKNLPPMQKTQVWSLGAKIPWRRAWQPTPVFWRNPWTEEPGGLQSTGLQIVGHDWVTFISLQGSDQWCIKPKDSPRRYKYTQRGIWRSGLPAIPTCCVTLGITSVLGGCSSAQWRICTRGSCMSFPAPTFGNSLSSETEFASNHLHFAP